MESTTIAVDLAKTVCQVAVSRRPGQIALERRLARAQLLPFFAQQPPSTVLLEACGSAHHRARELQQLGHTVRLLRRTTSTAMSAATRRIGRMPGRSSKLTATRRFIRSR